MRRYQKINKYRIIFVILFLKKIMHFFHEGWKICSVNLCFQIQPYFFLFHAVRGCRVVYIRHFVYMGRSPNYGRNKMNCELMLTYDTSALRQTMLIFRHIFLSNYWWQESDIWSQASYRYAILWEVFLDPSDSYFLFADLVGFYIHKCAYTNVC
jgi:hypothetical protein